MTDEDGRSTIPGVLISESLWRGACGSDPSIGDRTLTFDDARYAIVGVLPDAFRFPEARAEVWRVLPPEPPASTGRPRAARLTVGLLAPGVNRSLADERLLALSASFQESGSIEAGRVLSTGPLIQQTSTERYTAALYAMLGAAALVLLVAGINVANLLLARASNREGELAVLAALGATRGGLALATLSEGLLLAIAGGVAGLVVARAALAAVVAIQPPQMTYLTGVSASLNARVLAFAAGVSVLTCVLVSLVPSWRASRVDLVSSLARRSGRLAGADERWQSVLVGVQLSAVIVVLALTGMLIASFVRLVNVQPGFEPSGLVVADVMFSTQRDMAPRAGLTFAREVTRLVEDEVPGARAAYAVGGLPPYGGIPWAGAALQIDGRPPVDAGDVEWFFWQVSPAFFRTMEIPLTAGRAFEEHETDGVVIINDVMARRYWADASPIGSPIRLKPDDPWRTVVGVAGDVRHAGAIDERSGGMEMYLPFEADQRLGALHLLVRPPDRADGRALLRTRIRQLDPDLPATVVTMKERMAGSRWQAAFFLRLASAFSLAALAVAGVGVYGVAAYRVARRRREIALRIAVGATRGQIAGLVLRRGLLVAVVGVLSGLVAATMAADAIGTLPFTTTPSDPMVLAGSTAMVGALVLLASLVPAIRAGRVDPMTVLKSE